MFNYHSEVFKKCFCGNSKQSIFLNKSFSEENNLLKITGGSRSAVNQLWNSRESNSGPDVTEQQTRKDTATRSWSINRHRLVSAVYCVHASLYVCFICDRM